MNAKLAAQLTIALICMLPLRVSAQTWLAGRENAEGPGIRVGKSLILHPGAVVEGGWNTNPIRQSDSPDGSGRLRLGGYVDLATRGNDRRAEDEGVSDSTKQKILFRFGLAGFYDFFFSQVQTIKDQRDFGIDSHLNFALFPSGPYTLTLKLNYSRKIEPYESAEDMHARDFLSPGIGFQARPGGGTLMIGIRYNAGLTLFEDQTIADERNKITHEVAAEASWKVLPKTAAVSMVRFSPIFYIGGDSLNNDSRPVRALCGLRGLLTNRIGLSAFVGYGTSFYSLGENFGGVIASGELILYPTPAINIRLGGQRDFVDSFYANYYVKSGGYAKYSHMFAKVFLLSLKVEAFYRSYSTLTGDYRGEDQTVANRKEVWISSTLSLEYRATEWFSVLGSAVYRGNVSDFTYPTGTPVSFNEFEGLLGLRFHY